MPLVVEAPPDVTVLTEAAERAAAHWNLSAPELIRIGANGVFVADGVILRVGIATAPMGRALDFADRLMAAGVAAPRPARRDWLELEGGLCVTAWQRIELDPDAPIDWERIGAMVAVVHGFDPPSIDHPLPFCGDFPWWDFDSLLADAGADLETMTILRDVRDRHRWWYEHARRGRLVVCHGDVHPGNILVAADGPVLIDWDLLCVGPPEWDHAPMWTWTQRWGGGAGIYESFASGYGRAIDAGLAEAIAQLRLVAATLMRVRRARADPAQRDEADRRMRYWLGDPDAPAWQAQ